MKYKKTSILFILLLGAYLFFFFQADKIQTLSTFPGVEVNIQDVVWYEKQDLDFEEINIASTSGKNINGLYLSWTKNEVVYYFHGNGWPLPYFYSELKYIHDLGYWVFAFDYPWYGKSTWFPDKDLVSEFSKDFFEYIKKEKNVQNENLIIWWYSVGTAVATDFAAQNDFQKIILVSPFASRYDMWGRWLFWQPPQKFVFMKNSYVTSETVKQFQQPWLIIHGNADFIVPFTQWKQVFDNYAGQKSFIEINSFWHTGIIDTYWSALKNIFTQFISNEPLDFEYLLLDEQKKYDLEEEVKKTQKEQAFLSQDFLTDNSFIKYVSPENAFQKLDYEPEDLVNISSEYLQDVKWHQTLRQDAKNHLEILAKDFQRTFWVSLKVISAYRSYGYQVGIKSWGCNDIFCAKPGYSEHQTWLAFDMFEATTEKEFLSKQDLKKYFTWMQENAHKYGFNNSYQKGKEIDGYAVEPWHWRYVWIDFATYLWEKNISFWEFYNNYILKK